MTDDNNFSNPSKFSRPMHLIEGELHTKEPELGISIIQLFC